MLTSLIQAYRGQFRGSMNATRWVEKTTSTEIYASEVKSWFPNARFVHIIRDPRDNWASLRSGWEKRYRQFNDSYTRLLQSMIDRGRLGLEFARLNQASFGSEDYLVIRYEDLTAAPVAELRKICSFLSIDYDPTLLQPTVCGKFWEGNNFEGKVFRGPSNENVGRWRERIPETEAQLIEFHFKDVMDHFGYEQAFSLMQHANAAAHHYKWFNSTQRHKEESA